MKKLKNFVSAFAIVLFIPLFLFACNEATFDTTAWTSSSKTSTEVIEEVEDCREYMVGNGNDSASVPVTYETTTIFKFYATEDEVFDDKTVKIVSTATFSSAKIENASAQIVTKTYVEGSLASTVTSTYIRKSDDKGYIYTNQVTYLEEEETSLLNRASTTITDRTFYTMLGDIIIEAQTGEADTVTEKTFDDVQYYKLSANISNLENVQALFSEDSTLFDNPQLFVIRKKGEDYVMPFSFQYGINESNYITYFAMDYSIANSNLADGQNYETYLDVSSVTRLTKFGSAVETVSEPTNKDDFTVSTFKNAMMSDENYVVYKQVVDSTHYNNFTVQRREDGDILVKVEEYNSNSLTSTDYYYLDYNDDRTSFSAYQIFIETTPATYSTLDSYSSAFLNFDYSLSYFNTTVSGAYKYGTNDNYLLIAMQSGEVYSVSDGTNTWLVESFGTGETSTTLYDIDGLTSSD
jgi:hypothetical protein